jgi:transcriptional regulator with XRE-family HTH domain
MSAPASPITWLRLARETAHLSQAELADRARCTQAQISRFELKQSVPRAATQRRLAKALGVPAERLFAEALGNRPTAEELIDAYLRRKRKGHRS